MTTITVPTNRSAVLPVRVLEGVIALNGALAAALLLAPRTVRAPLDYAFFGYPIAPDFAGETARSAADIYAVIASGITLGWMIALFGLVRTGVARGDRTAWTFAFAAVLLWFAGDSAASIAVGYPVNALLNVGFALPLVGALLWARPR